MIFAKPSFKLAIGCIILWSLLAAIIIPNADKWFKEKSSSVKEDVVVFNTSQSPVHINDAIPTNYGRRNSITMNVSPIDNTPSVSHDGLKGILYDLGESCGDAPAPNLTPKSPILVSHNNVSRIAMVKQSESCFLADKIINAELDGAAAVIVYQLNTSLKSFKSLGVMPKTVNIPAYYIDPEAGHSLLQDLSKLYKKQNETTYGHSELLIRVTLLPAQKPILEPWEFAILFVGVILVASLIVIAGMQFCMWKLAKSRQRLESGSNTDLVLTTDEQRQLTSADEGFWRDIMGQNLSLQQLQQRGPIRQRLDQVLVDLLPTRVYQLGEVSEKKDGPAEPLYDPTSCVICLEELADGDVLRRLPCCHEYHQDCIDVWLTKRNNVCPLCLALVEIPALPEDCHHS